MKNILTIIRKEFARFFKDRIMIITILIPGLMIFLIYTVMGTVITDKASSDKKEKFSAYVVNMPLNENLNAGFDALLEIKEYSDVDAAKADVTEGVLDLVIIFPEIPAPGRIVGTYPPLKRHPKIHRGSIAFPPQRLFQLLVIQALNPHWGTPALFVIP